MSKMKLAHWGAVAAQLYSCPELHQLARARAEKAFEALQADLEEALLGCMAAGVPASNMEVMYRRPFALGAQAHHPFILFKGGML